MDAAQDRREADIKNDVALLFHAIDTDDGKAAQEPAARLLAGALIDLSRLATALEVIALLGGLGMTNTMPR